MTVAVLLAICCVVVSVVGCWYLAHHLPHRKTVSGPAASTGGPPTTRYLRSMGHSRHRWSGPRPRLELTGDGLRDSGPQVRFCLDCAAERTEDQPLNEMESK